MPRVSRSYRTRSWLWQPPIETCRHQPENFAFPKHVYLYDSLTFAVYYKYLDLSVTQVVLSEAARSNLRNCTFQNFPINGQLVSRTYIALTAIDAIWRQYSRRRITTGYHKHCTIAVGLASCLWLLRKVPYLVMASPPYFAAAMNKVNRRIDDNGDRPGYTNGLFSTTRMKLRVCRSLHS